MKALAALALLVLLASTAHAEADPDELMVDLSRALERWSSAAPCLELVARLERLGVPARREVYVPYGYHRGYQTFAALRDACRELERAVRRGPLEHAIAMAGQFPWAWAEECLRRWDAAIANGVDPNEYVEMFVKVRRLRRSVRAKGTLEQLRITYCDDAYRPRRRGE